MDHWTCSKCEKAIHVGSGVDSDTQDMTDSGIQSEGSRCNSDLPDFDFTQKCKVELNNSAENQNQITFNFKH